MATRLLRHLRPLTRVRTASLLARSPSQFIRLNYLSSLSLIHNVCSAHLLARSLATAASTPPRSGDAALSLPELRLISETGSMLGVMPPADALSIAKEKNLSLVEVQAHAVPPVWKLKEAPANAARAAAAAALGGGTSTAAPPDGKKERSSKPKKPPKEKEVRLTDSIAPRDAEHKIQSALKFLEKGHVVRVLVLNQGKRDPENKKKALAVTLIEQVCDACAEHASVSDIMGATGLRAAGETAITKQILGPAFAILTPRDGAFRQPATPRAPRKGDRRAAGAG